MLVVSAIHWLNARAASVEPCPATAVSGAAAAALGGALAKTIGTEVAMTTASSTSGRIADSAVFLTVVMRGKCRIMSMDGRRHLDGYGSCACPSTPAPPVGLV